MRKKITLLTLSVFALISIFAQTQNISFETWQQKSFTFDPSIIDPALGAFLPAETYSYSVPQNWSSINQISKYSLLIDISPGLFWVAKKGLYIICILFK
jgi:hypothetical protein